MLGRSTEGGDSWRLRGTARQIANFVAVAFVASAVLVAVIDHSTHAGWDAPLLQDWSLIPHGFTVLGLFYIARSRRSAAFGILGTLYGLIFVEEAFHVLNSLARWQFGAARWVSRRTPLSYDVANWTVLYASVAILGVALLLFAYFHAANGERRVVRNLALFLAVGGFFGGPISSFAALEDPATWTFIEELGEAMAYAITAGYVAGLVYAVAIPRLRKHPHRAAPREHP
jgi:hypothetical protein